MNQASRKQPKPLKDTWLHPSNFYFIFALLFGILFVIITPPYQVPDERAHFYRANQIAEGEFIYPDGQILQSVVDFTAEIGKFNLISHPENRISKRILINEWFRPLNKETKIFVTNIKTNNYSAFSYFPQAFGIVIGKTLNFSPYKLFLFTRSVNLFVGIFLFTAAIKLCPIRKWSLVIIGLLPMTLYQFASASPDTFVISLCTFYVAFLLNLQNQDQLNRKQLVLVLALTLSMAFIKPGYVFLTLLVLLVPIIPKNPKLDLLVKGLVILLTIALFYSWVKFTLNNVSGTEPLVAGVDPLAQFKFVLNRPFEFIGIFIGDFIKDFRDLSEMLIGKFGWLDTKLPNYWYLIYSGGLVLALIFDNCYKQGLTNRARTILLTTFFTVFVSTYSVFYLIWTPVAADYIQGYQGRYLLPILGTFYISLYNRFKPFKFNLMSILFPIWVVGAIVSLITVINRFYDISPIIRVVRLIFN